MRLMFDSTVAGDLPLYADMVACYANGAYANYPAVKARFPRIPVVSISVNASALELAHVLDIENGDALPARFQPWAHAMAARGVRRPTAYCSRSVVPLVLRLAPPGVVVDLWVADWTGHPHPLTFPGANVVAVQYAAVGHGSPGHYDMSAVYDDSWHPSPPAPG